MATLENKRSSAYPSLKGIAHVHTTFSHDGEISLERLAAICRAEKIDFALISEHAQDANKENLAQLINDCARFSRNGVLLVPGLEYEGEDDVHLLTYGIASFIDPKKKLIEIAEQVHKDGGLNVIAHPKRNGYFVSRGLLRFVNGIEIWNAKMDGSFAPNTKSLFLLRSSRSFNGKIFGYAGLDLHWKKQSIRAFMHVPLPSIHKGTLFSALSQGNFVVSGPHFKLNSLGDISIVSDFYFTLMNASYTFFCFSAKKVLYRNLKKMLGEEIGRSLKRHFRRFLY